MAGKRTLKIFISSTFQDMMAERDFILDRVIRPFKKKAKERNVDVSVVDLRWGITPQEAKDGRVLEICLRQIDNCRPLFIGIVGKRYGWCPSYNEFLQNDFLRTRYPEIEEYFKQGLSITEMEMQYGAINSKKETDAIFFLQCFDIEKQVNFNNKEEELRLQNLREKIVNHPNISYYTYDDSDIHALDMRQTIIGGQLSEWLENELDKYFPDIGENIEKPIVCFDTKEQRKNYLQEILIENGKSLSDYQAEIILASRYTQKKKGMDSLIDDLLTFGVFEQLDTFINWRANISPHDYDEYILKRRLSIYTIQMIHVIQVVALTRYGADWNWLHKIYYLTAEKSDFDSALSLYLEDAKELGLIREIKKDYRNLYVISERYRDSVFKLLLLDEATIERTRIRLIEAILGYTRYDNFLKCGKLDDLSYSEFIHQKNRCPSMDRYEYNWEGLCRLMFKQISDLDYKDTKQIRRDGLETLDDYRRAYAETRLFGEFDCTKSDGSLYELVEYLRFNHLRPNYPDLPSELSKEEIKEMKSLYYKACQVLQNSEDELTWEQTCEWGIDIEDDDSCPPKDVNIIWYEGDLNDDHIPHGHGKAHFRNTDTYEGDWNYGERHGYGLYESAGRYIYEGEFKNGRMDGYGTLYYLSNEDGYEIGDRYEGDFENGGMNGYGTLYFVCGGKFEGCFSSNKRNGEGVLSLPNGATITGKWEDDNRKGLFTLTLPDGRQYQREY